MMACLNMLSSEQQAAGGVCGAIMGPRISFSNDFADSQHPSMRLQVQDHCYKEAPVSSDFEFSVSGNNMISADEVFCKGKLMPLKDKTTTTTIRDELLQANDDDDDYAHHLFGRMPKQGMRGWRERFGLIKTRSHHICPRKSADKNLERIDEATPEK